MTQMLLFDSPSRTASFGGGCLMAPATADSRTEPSASTESLDAAPSSRFDRAAEESGLHHMGDLARLVLLRYELVAKRRAMLAARKAK